MEQRRERSRVGAFSPVFMEKHLLWNKGRKRRRR